MQRKPFGQTRDGQAVEIITLDNDQLSCTFLTYGATLVSLNVPDKEGKMVDVALGYDTLDAYESQDKYLGATVGRYANRIAAGRFTLDGVEYTLAVNDGDNHLHGGPTRLLHPGMAGRRGPRWGPLHLPQPGHGGGFPRRPHRPGDLLPGWQCFGGPLPGHHRPSHRLQPHQPHLL